MKREYKIETVNGTMKYDNYTDYMQAIRQLKELSFARKLVQLKQRGI